MPAPAFATRFCGLDVRAGLRQRAGWRAQRGMARPRSRQDPRLKNGTQSNRSMKQQMLKALQLPGESP